MGEGTVIEGRQGIWRRTFDTVMVYILWVIVILLALWMLITARGAVNVVYIVLTWNRWVLRAIDRWSLLLLGVFWLVGVIISEDYFRKGAEKGDLYKRFAKVAGAEVFIGAVLSLIQAISA